MNTYLKLLYKPFYDLAFTRDYIKNGRGTGIAVLALISLFFTGLFTGFLYSKAAPFITTEKLTEYVEEFFYKLPPIVIEDGELIWADDTIEKYNLDSKAILIVDTQHSSPPLHILKEAAFYLTSTDIYINNQKNRIQSISLADIQNLFGENPLDFSSAEAQDTIVFFLQYFMFIGAVISFIFMFAGLLLFYGILGTITRAIAKRLSNKVKALEIGQYKRASAVAVTPVIITISLFTIFIYGLGFWLTSLLVIVTGILLIIKYAPIVKKNNKQKSKP